MVTSLKTAARARQVSATPSVTTEGLSVAAADEFQVSDRAHAPWSHRSCSR